MRCTVKVTFEFTERPPITAELKNQEATTLPPLVRRAVKEAQRALKPRNWASAVVLVLRDDVEVEEEVE